MASLSLKSAFGVSVQRSDCHATSRVRVFELVSRLWGGLFAPVRECLLIRPLMAPLPFMRSAC